MDTDYYKQYEPFFGSWKIVRLIGEGTYGKVFEICRSEYGIEEKAALKIISIPASKSEYNSVLTDCMDERSATEYFRNYMQEMIREISLMSKLKGNSKSVPPLAAIKTPLRDGDIERPDDPAYANAYFINANSATAPGIVDADRNPVLTRSEVYSGVYGRASINLYAFNSNGNKGIACGLNNLQKIRDGEPLGGRTRAEDDFATDDDDDFLS